MILSFSLLCNFQEGQAQAAVLNSHADDDGIIDKEEGRNIAKAHKKALENRGRGSNQYQIVRTGRCKSC